MMFNASCIVQGAVEFNNSAIISVVTHSGGLPGLYVPAQFHGTFA